MKDINLFSKAPVYFKAVVAEEQTVVVDELTNRGDVPAGIHDGELRARQVVDVFEQRLISKVGGLVYQIGKVVSDEDGCVAVLGVRRVGGQPDDSVVRDAALAGQVERLHPLGLI